MSREVEFTERDEQLIDQPMVVRLWKEGKRVVEVNAFCIEYDGDCVEIFTQDGDMSHNDGEWDEMTVQYSP